MREEKEVPGVVVAVCGTFFFVTLRRMRSDSLLYLVVTLQFTFVRFAGCPHVVRVEGARSVRLRISTYVVQGTGKQLRGQGTLILVYSISLVLRVAAVAIYHTFQNLGTVKQCCLLPVFN